jgi:NAD(P)-dependent dehydrogenase (short-subunit alcohol dehydrogenase family)
MANELNGKVAIVTGGSSGIGEGTAERFVAEGAKVVIADVNEEQGNAVAARLGPDAIFKRTDVSDQAQILDLVAFTVKTFGGLHIMFNNAGIAGARHPRLFDEDFKDFERIMAVNLLGVMAGTREAAREMAKTGGGSIVNIASVGGIQAAPGNWSYHASKSSVVFFTKCAAVDLGEYNIRVNCLAPANIETPILAGNMLAGVPEHEKAGRMKKLREFIISLQALPIQGHTDDVAEAALYLCSDRSRYVTGTVTAIDGGMIAGIRPTSPKALAEVVGGGKSG